MGVGRSGRIEGRVVWIADGAELIFAVDRGVGGEFLVVFGGAARANAAYRSIPPAYSEAISLDSSWKCTGEIPFQLQFIWYQKRPSPFHSCDFGTTGGCSV